MSEFTKGDWEADDLNELIHAGDVVVAEMWYGGRCSASEIEANAHLIASAPDMYDRLKKTQIVFGAAMKAFGEVLSSGTIEELLRILEENKQALAKAEGNR